MAGQSADRALVERVRQGDRRAFDLLVLKYQGRIIKLVGRYVHDSSDAQDVAQEAFLKAYRALPRFRGDSAFYTWIYRIAINTAKNYLAAQSRRTPQGGFEQVDGELMERDSRFEDVATPEHNILRDEIKSTLTQAIVELPVDLRTAVTLRELDGMSYEEIAEAMECPIGTVRSRIFRAREAINRRLESLLD
ncbi:MAG: RNA polymerase sigma factor RpoE [Gammaproteobacteria bacterium]|nr:RNA polymerase sigma factor RpoE [Gammaproteobacteria bacterium]